MGYYLQIDDALPTPIASNQGWNDFCRWAEHLDPEKSLQVIHLCDHGWCQDVGGFKTQLAAAVEASKLSGDIRTTADGIIDLLNGESPVVITVTNGIG